MKADKRRLEARLPLSGDCTLLSVLDGTRAGSIVKTSLGFCAGRRPVSMRLVRGDSAELSEGSRPLLDHRVEKHRDCWWIPAGSGDAVLLNFAMRKMDIVVLSENGAMAHF